MVLSEAELARTVEQTPHEALAAHKAWIAAKEAAAKAEREAIAAEAPLLNILHNRGRHLGPGPDIFGVGSPRSVAQMSLLLEDAS